jgi:hypothetical protein
MGDSGMSSGTSSKGEDVGCFERGSRVEIRDKRGRTFVVGVIGVGVSALWTGMAEAVDRRGVGFVRPTGGAADNLGVEVVEI